MLNLLIALMGGSYERVAETAKLVTLKNRAELILQYEMRMSEEQLADRQWHPTHLHALVPADDDVDEELDDDEAGVINGVKRLLVADRVSAEKQMVANQAAVEQRVGGIEEKITKHAAEGDAKIEVLRQQMTGMEGKIDAIQVQMNTNMEAILKKLEAHPLMR